VLNATGIGVAFSAYDAITADSGYDRAAAAINVAAAGAGLIPGVGWALPLGLSLTAAVVGEG
jgi:hypothetical protein